MRANARKLNVDPDRIGVIGGSAGGHLAMMIGYSSDAPKLEGTGGHAGVSSRVQAVVNLYGPVDLTTPYASGNSLIIRFLGGKTIEESRTRHELASPISHITRDDPPTLIFHGTIDDMVPIDQADRLAEKLKSTRVPYRYNRLEGWPHAIDLAEVVNQRCQRLMMEFFKKHLLKPWCRIGADPHEKVLPGCSPRCPGECTGARGRGRIGPTCGPLQNGVRFQVGDACCAAWRPGQAAGPGALHAVVCRAAAQPSLGLALDDGPF